MLQFSKICLRRHQKSLLNEASFLIKPKHRVGLIGHNGCGKSSLFSLIKEEIHCDSGVVTLNKHTRLSHLAQQTPNSTANALDYVLEGNLHYQDTVNTLKQAELHNEAEKILALHDLMHQQAYYALPSKAASLLCGLGFTNKQQQQCVNDFSGGWRMRLSLARTLMTPADLLLLDEPTNHLDLDAILWLEQWLTEQITTMIIISHDRDFLDNVTTHTLHIDHLKTHYYPGNYSAFERLRAEKLLLQQTQYEKQQKHIQHMMDFVQRFRAKASKAKQAQSRLKAVEKLELIAQAQLDSPFHFSFLDCPKSADPLISLEDVSLGYTLNNPILKQINFTLRKAARIGLLGPNGAGKSTFIKSLTGELSILSGIIEQAGANCHIAYFAQHQLEQLDDNASALTHLQRIDPRATEQTLKNYLGGFNFIGDMATTDIAPFSGGEKARLALALLVWQKPNILLLDEPTNHLDIAMRSAIECALQSYQGALILVSHDRHLLKTCVDEYWLVANQQVTAFHGDLMDYHQWLNQQNKPNKLSSKEKTPSRHKNQRIKNNRIKKIDTLLHDFNKELKSIEVKLNNNALYQAENARQLDELLARQSLLKKQIEPLEEEWLILNED